MSTPEPSPGATGVYPPVPPNKTNDLAIVALICGIIVAPVGIILGHISLSQIKKSNEEGRGLALAGLIIGYVFTAFAVIWMIVSIVAVNSVMSSVNDSMETFETSDAFSASKSRELQLGVAEKYLADIRSQSVRDLEAFGFRNINPKNSEDSSNDELGDSYFVDLYSVWKIGQTGKSKAQIALSGLIDPSDSDETDFLMSKIGVGGSPLFRDIYITGAWTSNMYKTDVPFASRNGYATRLLTQQFHENSTDTDAGYLVQFTYQQQAGISPDGKSFQKFIIMKTINVFADDSGYISDLRTYDGSP